jgi:hypothetical protein
MGSQADGPDDLNTSILVAEYVRMSTEHQQYSTENQSRVIAEYAKSRGMGVVRSYADSRKSVSVSKDVMLYNN